MSLPELPVQVVVSVVDIRAVKVDEVSPKETRQQDDAAKGR